MHIDQAEAIAKAIDATEEALSFAEGGPNGPLYFSEAAHTYVPHQELDPLVVNEVRVALDNLESALQRLGAYKPEGSHIWRMPS